MKRNELLKYLKLLTLKISQSRIATPEDNTFIESFFKTMKKEEVYFKDYKTMNDVIKNLPKFIDDDLQQETTSLELGV